MKGYREVQKESGDTLIEVLLAIAVLSAVVVGAVGLMNRGHAMGRDALERSQVTSLMTEQAEMLQYLRDSYADADAAGQAAYPASLWTTLLGSWTAAAEPQGCQVNSKAFYLERSSTGPGGDVSVVIKDFNENTINPSSTDYVETYAKPGSGLWVEAERPAPGTVGVDYVNFYIKACWSSASEGPRQEAKTVVRLYVP